MRWLALGTLIAATAGLPTPARADVLDFLGKKIVDVRVEVGGHPADDETLTELIETRAGEPLTMIAVRQTIDHLTGLGRYQDIRVFATPAAAGEGVALQWSLVPVQRLVRVRFSGTPVFSAADLEAAVAARDRTLSLSQVPAMIEILQGYYEARGHRRAVITSQVVPTDRPDEAEIDFNVQPGPRTHIASIAIEGNPPASEREVLDRLGLAPGQPLNRSEIEQKMAEYEERLRGEGYYEASIRHREVFAEDGSSAALTVTVEPGPRVRLVFAGDPLPGNRRDELVPIRRERSVDEDLLEDSARNIERYLRDQGYRSATVRYMRSEEAGELVPTFTVDRGPLYRVAAVDVTGAASLSQAELAPVLKLTPGEPFVDERASLVASAIAELYQVRGYASTTVKVETPAQTTPAAANGSDRAVAVTFIVTEGPRTMVSDVTIEGASAIDEASVRALLGLAPGRPFYRPQLAADREAVERAYRNQGFQRATVEVRPTISATGETVALHWVINEGDQSRVDRILVVGNERTSASVIRRELALAPGDPIGEDALVESQRRLASLGLFRRVRITELPFGTGARRDLLVAVEEAPSTTVAYGGGLEVQRRGVAGPDGTVEDKLDFAPRAFFEIGRRNLWGKNRSVNLFTRVSFRRRDPSPDDPNPSAESSYGFNEYRLVGTYREPRAFGTPGDVQLTGFLEQAIRASYSFRRRGATAEYARRLGQMFAISGRYTLDRTELFDEKIAQADQPLIDRLFPQVRLSTLTGSILRDSRDDVLDPQRGTVLGVDGSLALPAIGSQVGFARSLFRAFYYQRLPGSSRFVLATGLRVGVARAFSTSLDVAPDVAAPFELPASERFYAGGDTTVRGFALDRLGTDETLDENGFPKGGNGLLVANVEVRTPYWKGLGLVGFLDGGNVYRLAREIDLSEIRGSTGFGIRYRSPLGPLRVDLGFKLDPRLLANGSRERREILHISLGQAF